MPSSKFGRRVTALPPPSICTSKRKGRLGEIAWPPNVILAAVRSAWAGPVGVHYSIAGLVRCKRFAGGDTYYAELIRPPALLTVLVTLDLPAHTAKIHMWSEQPASPEITSDAGPDQLVAGEPINHIFEAWTITPAIGSSAEAQISA